jgi:hypothetical protein
VFIIYKLFCYCLISCVVINSFFIITNYNNYQLCSIKIIKIDKSCILPSHVESLFLFYSFVFIMELNLLDSKQQFKVSYNCFVNSCFLPSYFFLEAMTVYGLCLLWYPVELFSFIIDLQYYVLCFILAQ